ncbi:hypothetical protein LCGC14_1883300 [marine sediment metagenome]|uniref:Uncharacterized protein n=1 Tax=marine sediment metagenome TaxID=412755 RepID=A0A0F9G1P7_9ZZZZ
MTKAEQETTLLPAGAPDVSTDGRGSTVSRWHYLDTNRYRWDFGPCGPGTGWDQYDTDQDAWYFGIWVHVTTRRVLTYAEGDLTLVECHTADTFRAELAAMPTFHGDPPPAFRVINVDAGTLTRYYAERPT